MAPEDPPPHVAKGWWSFVDSPSADSLSGWRAENGGRARTGSNGVTGGAEADAASQHTPHELSSSVDIPNHSGFSWQKLWAFMGPGFLVSIAYIDPGNFAVDIEAGSQHKYMLIWVLLLATMLGLALQSLCARLGVVSGRNLAQMCREAYPRKVSLALWVVAEITVIASDIPEVIGTAMALKLLCSLELWIGVIITSISVLLFLGLSYFGVRKIELVIGLLLSTVLLCFVVEFFKSDVSYSGLARGFVPTLTGSSLYSAVAIVGAVVMPHNLFLHSALVQTRKIQRSSECINEACRYNFIESAVALSISFIINVSIVCVSAADFAGKKDVGLLDVPKLLKSTLGNASGVLFAVALLCAGQSSTMTGTYAGQFVMEGFLKLRMAKWLRAVITRTTAIFPSLLVALLAGDKGSNDLIVFSQVLLAVQLPFALIPLLKFASNSHIMGQFATVGMTRYIVWTLGTAIICANLGMGGSWVSQLVANQHGGMKALVIILAVVICAAYLSFLFYLIFTPVTARASTWIQMDSLDHSGPSSPINAQTARDEESSGVENDRHSLLPQHGLTGDE